MKFTGYIPSAAARSRQGGRPAGRATVALGRQRLAPVVLSALLGLGAPACAAATQPGGQEVGAAVAKVPASPPAPLAGTEDLATLKSRAGQARKALVLEFGAQWCGPCQVFDHQVLPQVSVQQALGHVMYVHYDAETPIGQTAARTLGIIGYPTFVALGQDGREIGRLQGYREAGEFSKWVEGAAADAEPTAALQARAEAPGAPAEVLLQLGRRRLKSGDEPGAETMLGRAQKAPGLTPATAAAADWELRLLQLRRQLRDEPRKAMIEHLNRFPASASATTAFTALSHLGPADAPTKLAIGRYIDAHLEASQEEHLNNAVYGCLRAGALDAAERAARRLVALDGKNPSYLDTLAEVMHLRGDRATALRYSHEALAALAKVTAMSPAEQQQTRAALLKNQARFERAQRELPTELQGEDEVLQPWEKN